MRNLTICLVAFAVAFSICGLAFRSVVAANGRTEQHSASESHGSAMMSGPGGRPAILDDELY